MISLNNQFYLPLLALFLLHLSCSSNSKDDPRPETESGQEEVEQEETEEETNNQVNIVWENWYLSVPVDRGNGSATSIFFEDIESENLTSEQQEYFYKGNDGSYTMYTKFTGFTTSGGPYGLDEGKYCRTELREFWEGNQSTSDNWLMSTGVHVLESTLKVDYCEGSGQTYIAQIHGKESEGIEGAPATIKIQWKNGDLVVEYYTKPDAGEPWTSDFDEKITIGKVDNEIFTIKLKVEEGKFYYGLVCEEKQLDIGYTFVFDYVGNGYVHENYFKTGNYFKWNDDYEESAQVTFYKVVTEHL